MNFFTWFRDSQGTFDDTGEIELTKMVCQDQKNVKLNITN